MDEVLFGAGIVGLVIFIITAIAIYYLTIGHQDQKKTKQCKFSATDPEVVIIGAGTAGASLAAALGKDGRRVIVIERDMSPPNTFRGEALQPGGVKALQDMGLGDIINDYKGMPFAGIRVLDYETGVELKARYSRSGYTAFHGNFVQAIRRYAKLQPTVKVIEGAATEVLEDNGRVVGVKYRAKDSQDSTEMRAPLTVVCDGYYSKLRSPNATPSEIESYWVGIEVKNVQQPDPLFPSIIVGNQFAQIILYPLDDVESRLFVVFRNKPQHDDLGLFLEKRVVPNLPDFLQTAAYEAIKHKTYYKCVAAKRTPPTFDNIPGKLVLGDAFNTSDAILGTGQSILLKDVRFWQQELRDIPDLSDDAEFLKKKALFKKHRRPYSWTINMAVHALTTLGSERERSSVMLRQVLLHNYKAYENAAADVQTDVYDMFAVLNCDERLLWKLLLRACRDAVLQCLSWRSVIQPLQTTQDIYGILAKCWNIVSTEV